MNESDKLFEKQQQPRQYAGVLLWVGGGFVLLGISAGQFLAVSAGLMALMAGGAWYWSLRHEYNEAVLRGLRERGLIQ